MPIINLLVCVGFGLGCAETSSIHIYCEADNDVYKWLCTSKQAMARHDQIELALNSCDMKDVLLVLAKDYPQKKTVLPRDFYQIVKEKELQVYVEFPDRLPLGQTGSISETSKERLVIESHFFADQLDSSRILDAGLYRYTSFERDDPMVVGAKVAGFDKTVYEMDDSTSHPILFLDDGVLISTTKLSDFRKSRYAPWHGWVGMWEALLGHLNISTEVPADFEPVTKPSFLRSETLPPNAYELAIDRSAEWYEKGRFLIHPSWKDHWKSIDTLNPPVGPPMELTLPSGDGSMGVMEGHYSYINSDGSQPYRYWLRADCVAETAMTLAMTDEFGDQQGNRQVAKNLMDFLFNSETFMTTSSRDINQSSYGLVGWADTHPSRYYGDDNARVTLGSILASQLLNDSRWDQQITELILANFRTAGKKGFRRNALMGRDIDAATWQVLMQRDFENIAPHYESWLWATYLWLFDKTGYQPLLKKARSALEITMKNYPDNWKWANGLQQERARMVLPLAWLVRVEDSDTSRQWLTQICDDLLRNQVACGALQEELGVGDNGKYGAPTSNAHYGTTEAPVIHFNGDPVADMLYTTNFAFFALNEAAQVTKNPKYLEAVDRMADFLVRVQSKSSGRADLDGCWFRAFDFENWEYYGSNADHGWGAWGTLTGWTQSFITTTLALKVRQTSYWEITKNSRVGAEISELWNKMLPGIDH